MRFTDTTLSGAYLVDLEPIEDSRGFFARTWCARELEAHGLDSRVAQCSVSQNLLKGTLRGLHYQTAPFQEVKLVRCTCGSIYDVILDLRPDSPTFCRHFGAILTADNHRALYVPKGFAHGFLTLSDNAEVFYQISEFYEQAASRGVRWNDAAFGIEWPAAVAVIADRDRSYPDFNPGPRKES